MAARAQSSPAIPSRGTRATLDGVAGGSSGSFVLPSSLQPSWDLPGHRGHQGGRSPSHRHVCLGEHPFANALWRRRAGLETPACHVSKIKHAAVCPRQLLCHVAGLGARAQRGHGGIMGTSGEPHDAAGSGRAPSALVPPAGSPPSVATSDPAWGCLGWGRREPRWDALSWGQVGAAGAAGNSPVLI